MWPQPEAPAGQSAIPDNFKDSLIADARLGWVEFDEEAFVEEYGSVYKDTNLVNLINWIDQIRWDVKDSLNIKDSTIYRFVSIPVAMDDAILPFQSEFKTGFFDTPGWKYSGSIALHTDYTYPPKNEFAYNWTVQDGTLTDIRPFYMKPWFTHLATAFVSYELGRVRQILKDN